MTIRQIKRGNTEKVNNYLYLPENSLMELGKFKTREVPQTILRLHPDLRDELIRVAAANGRSLTKEISARLQVSLTLTPASLPTRLAQAVDLGRRLPASYTAANASATYPANEQSPADALTDIDRAMLAVFRALPPEKQLALLSLFR